MRLKTLLLIILMSGGILHAEDTIRSLVITEACLSWMDEAYVEITNMGDKDVQLGNFKIGNIEPWGNPPFIPRVPEMVFQLPEKILSPGESFLIATVYDFEPTQHAKGLERFSERRTKEEMWELADVQYHMKESDGDATDSVTNPQRIFSEVVWGRNCIFIEQHFENGDSVVIDQVNGVFDGEDGLNLPFDQRWPSKPGYDVAGVVNASYEAYLIRKFSVKQGNLDFASARGVGIDDSEWIAIPRQGGPWRKAMWTVGNHANAKLDENTLESDVVEVDFANKTLTVPWGIRRSDDIMNYFVKKPGIGWNYHLAPNTSAEDSVSFTAKTGDQLQLFVCGEGLDLVTFEIIVKEPTTDAKLAVPKLNADAQGNWKDQIQNGILTWPRITRNESDMDTIWGEYGGIPYATRIDSLLDRIEIPSNASWELVTVDGLNRPDLKGGDKLKIVAKDGSEKEYYILVNGYLPSHNAQLSSITWPDIPGSYRGIFGWLGDTIPNFGGSVFNYKVTVPLDVDGIPGLIAKTADLNAQVEVVRASSLNGTTKNRTISFIVTAEDDTTINTYNVELIKERNPNDIQPFTPDPFISEIVWKEQWANSWMEIFNPGTEPIDLSNYMFVNDWPDDPAVAVSNSSSAESYARRYNKYIPGYKYTNNEADWASNPGILESDLNVNPIVMPGDVFVLADIRQWWTIGYPWYASKAADIDFGKHNPWGENIGEQNSAIGQWGGVIFMFKIENDSIKSGLKAPNDINDFQLLDIFDIGQAGMTNDYRRKPEIWKGNPLFGDSQDEENDKMEWVEYTQSDFEGPGISWNQSHSAVATDVGQHFLIQPTAYMSTVSSVVYKVSPGYSKNESIKGMTTGITVANFMTNLIKADENQMLNVLSSADGSALSMDAVLSMNDILVVMSADSTNTTKYILEVSEVGLSSDAVLTSSRYTITITSEPKSGTENENAGTAIITGFDYGTSLKTILANITVPASANMDVVDLNGAYVPLIRLNFDTSYVNVTVNSNIYMDVVAENGVTEIVYQLIPTSTDKDAFVLSDIYNVIQKEILIQYVPRGTTANTLLSNIVASAGASIKVVNKMGMERLSGRIADDDKVVVTSSDGSVSKAYYLSMLAEEYVRETTYLAYILSATYPIDQVGFRIDGVDGKESIANFMTKVTPAAGANAVVIDKDGMEKNSGDIDRDDKVKVTSADGKIVVMYSFGILTSNKTLNQNEISVYPNPTNNEIKVAGVEPGDRIQVINSVGTIISDVNVVRNIESFSLRNKSAGIYMVVISKSNSITGRYKVVKF